MRHRLGDEQQVVVAVGFEWFRFCWQVVAVVVVAVAVAVVVAVVVAAGGADDVIVAVVFAFVAVVF